MIRDITLGQYYPANSILHKMDPRAKLVGTMVFIISVFVFHTFPGYAVATLFLEIHVQGTEGDRNAAYDHSSIQHPSDTRKSPLAVGNPACNRRRPETGRKNGNPPDLPCDRFLNYDADNNTKSAHRWSGTTSQTAE